MKTYSVSLLLCLSIIFALDCNRDKIDDMHTFEKIYPLSSQYKNCVATQAIETRDGNYLIVGGCYDEWGKGGGTAFILKLDRLGNILDSVFFGGPKFNWATCVKEWTNGHIFILTAAINFDITDRYYYLTRFDKSLETVSGFPKKFSTGLFDSPDQFIFTPDGELLLSGATAPTYGVPYTGIFLVKCNLNGDTISSGFTRVIPQQLNDDVNWIISSKSGGYFIVGTAPNGPNGKEDIQLTKLDMSFEVVSGFPLQYGTTSIDKANSVLELVDGSLVILGNTTDGQADYNYDIWLLQLDNTGRNIDSTLIGSKSYREYAAHFVRSQDGGFALAGHSNDPAGHGGRDFVLYKLNKNFGHEWHEHYGTSGNDEEALHVIQTSDGGFLITGYTTTPAGEDVYIVKTDKNGN